MNLQRLAEVRNNLQNLASISAVLEGIPQTVHRALEEFGKLRCDVFPRRMARGTEQITPVVEAPRPPRYQAVEHVVRVQVKTPKPVEIPAAPTRSRQIPASNAYSPERYVPIRVLWAKVIIRASYDYALWKDSKDLRLKKYAQEAERWMFEPSVHELSFENICFAFDFPTEKIRTRTRALTKNDVKKLEFRERHSRSDILAAAAVVPEEPLGDD